MTLRGPVQEYLAEQAVTVKKNRKNQCTEFWKTLVELTREYFRDMWNCIDVTRATLDYAWFRMHNPQGT